MTTLHLKNYTMLKMSDRMLHTPNRVREQTDLKTVFITKNNKGISHHNSIFSLQMDSVYA